MKVLEREAGEVSHGGHSFAPIAKLFKSNDRVEFEVKAVNWAVWLSGWSCCP
jgi:hypothetical protein